MDIVSYIKAQFPGKLLSSRLLDYLKFFPPGRPYKYFSFYQATDREWVVRVIFTYEPVFDGATFPVVVRDGMVDLWC